MVKTEKLKQMIKDKGYSYTDIGKKIGVTYTNMNKRLNNISSFKSTDIYIICDLLDITDWEEIKDIFFNNVQKVA